MPESKYVSDVRSRIGHDLLLLPAVTAVIRDGDRYLLARQRDSDVWGLIGGGIEPGEEPADAVAREVREEIGVQPAVGRLIGAYGGDDLIIEYPNGDRVGYTTIAFECSIPAEAEIEFEDGELIEVAWFTAAEVAGLRREPAVDRMLHDAVPPAARVVEKAVCYVVADEHILVFTHDAVDLAVTGVQVPAGTIRIGEQPAEAAVRELLEETGLAGRIVRSLGAEDYDMQPARAEIARRHFFLMAVDDPELQAQWTAGEDDASTGTGHISWTCRWIPLTQAHVLAGGLGAKIGAATDPC